jgi:hypothetical protein
MATRQWYWQNTTKLLLVLDNLNYVLIQQSTDNFNQNLIYFYLENEKSY